MYFFSTSIFGNLSSKRVFPSKIISIFFSEHSFLNLVWSNISLILLDLGIIDKDNLWLFSLKSNSNFIFKIRFNSSEGLLVKSMLFFESISFLNSNLHNLLFIFNSKTVVF